MSNISGCNCGTVRPDGQSDVRSIWMTEEPKSCVLKSGRIGDEELFRDILTVRNATDDRWPDQRTSVDYHSDHYCMYVDNLPVGSLGVTRALDGEIFMAEYCPPRLLEEFHDSLVSAYRFRIKKEYRRSSTLIPGISLSRQIVREAWREQISKGAGIDVINIEKSYARLYEAMGYVLCDGSAYTDPVLGTESCIMFLPVDPNRESFISDIIKESDFHIPIERVMKCLTRTSVYVANS
ncbi:MAG: hypothetical protein IT291_08680 [Deltaproteobacteria bacterium]|nr:hypothetical protein [Deltaproteobacteria bacterium]